MVLEYGDEHGRSHFGGNPTKKKPKWSLDKPGACRVMEAVQALLANKLRYHGYPDERIHNVGAGTVRNVVGQ